MIGHSKTVKLGSRFKPALRSESIWSLANLRRRVGTYLINLIWLSVAALIGAYLGEIIIHIAGVEQFNWVRPAYIVGIIVPFNLLILGAARMNKITLAIVCAVVSISYFVPQCLYAYSEEPTVGFVYVYFYFVGTPVALLWVLISYAYNFTRPSLNN